MVCLDYLDFCWVKVLRSLRCSFRTAPLRSAVATSERAAWARKATARTSGSSASNHQNSFNSKNNFLVPKRIPPQGALDVGSSNLLNEFLGFPKSSTKSQRLNSGSLTATSSLMRSSCGSSKGAKGRRSATAETKPPMFSAIKQAWRREAHCRSLSILRYRDWGSFFSRFLKPVAEFEHCGSSVPYLKHLHIFNKRKRRFFKQSSTVGRGKMAKLRSWQL